MRFKILPTCFVALAVSVLCLVAAGTARADSSQFFGAIFTTLKDGTAVNANIYLNCCGTD